MNARLPFSTTRSVVAEDLLSLGMEKYGAILADPPWQFSNRTGKMAPEHKSLSRYRTMTHQEIMELPIAQMACPNCHLYLWVPNALILEGLEVMRRWGFKYKTNIVWYKIRKDGGPDGRGVGFYFRNVTELVLFGVRGAMRTLAPGRTQVNILSTRKREHSRKPDELYDVIERCSPGPYLELFARHSRPNWSQWGNQIGADAAGKPYASSYSRPDSPQMLLSDQTPAGYHNGHRHGHGTLLGRGKMAGAWRRRPPKSSVKP
jgi:N6-adenosine-specific RNA methylase IME4